MFNIKIKKAISPVVAIALLLVVAVIAVVGFQGWFSEFSSYVFIDAESQTSSTSLVSVEGLVGNKLYINSKDNSSITSVKINNIDCNFNGSISGMDSINISSCLENISGSANIVVVMDDRVIESYKYIDDIIVSELIIPINYIFNFSMNRDLSTADASFIGEVGWDEAGSSFSGVGDVNGDGFDDFLIGAHGNDESDTSSGQSYLIFGKSTGWNINIDLSTSNASFIGESANDHSGQSVSGVGDVNRDGFDDFLIGAYYDDDGGIHSGQSYLILGKSNDWSIDTNLSTSDASFFGESVEDKAGMSVSGAGDVNGDGFDDFIIGAPGDDDGGNGAGQTYLIFGKLTGWNMDANLSNSNASFIGEEVEDSSGYSLSGAGDVNGDGFDDFLIGVQSNDKGGNFAGQTYLIFGKSTGWNMYTDLSTANASFFGESANDRSGISTSGVGDVNGDGFDDFLIGAYGNDEGGDSVGQSYLIFGKLTGWDMYTNLSAANASFIGELANDNSGSSLSGVGDVNGDGFDDFLIGASSNDEGGSYAGQSYLILGKSIGWSMDVNLSTADASFIAESANDQSGKEVSGVGDVNGDGFDDFLICAQYAEGYAGKSYLILDIPVEE